MVAPEEKAARPGATVVATDAGDDAAIHAAVERFVAAHGCGEALDPLDFSREYPERIRPRVLAQCREFLAFDGLLGHQEWERSNDVECDTRTFGDFEIREELGRGGMGIVYLARQRSLNRLVALKVMASGLTLSKRHVERFRREAAAAAQLRHPAIVPVHSLVEVDGTFAIAMDYIAGRNLGDILDDLRLANGTDPGPVEGSLGLDPTKGYVAEGAMFCAQLASALASAHAQGVMHRDLKPRNLMIDDRRQVRLLDFGLSKSLGDGTISMSGEITGTVHYMSPEQTMQQRVDVDHRTDVFALGVILYEILTLRRPFDGRDMQQIVYEICFKEPTPPNRLNPKVPRDLVTVCLKALEKDPTRRYASAAEFEADLLRFLRWEPVHARPATTFSRLAKWARRHRTEVIAAAAVAALAAGGGGYTVYAAAREDRLADDLVASARQAAMNGRYDVALGQAMRALAKRDDDEVRQLIDNYRLHLTNAAKQEEVDIAEAARLSLASHQTIPKDRELAILLALAAVDRHDSTESRSAVLRALGSGFHKLGLDGHPGGVLCARWAPDGKSLVTSGIEEDGSATAILWSADGERRHVLRGHAGWIIDARFHPGGKLLATASVDHSVRLWRVDDGELAGVWQSDAAVQSIHFDAVGRRALIHGHAGRHGPFLAETRDVVTGHTLGRFDAHSQFITAAALSADGRFAASAGDPGFARLWDAEDGHELARLEGHRKRIASIAFAPNGETVATACHDGEVRLFSVPDGKLLASAAHSRPIQALAFAPGGDRLLTGADDATARLWRIERSEAGVILREEHQFAGDRSGVTSVGFDPSGRRAFTADAAGVVRIFDAGPGRSAAGTELMHYEAGGGSLQGAAFDATGHRVLAWSRRHALIWDSSDARGVITLRQPGRVPAVSFDRSGTRVVTAGDDELLRLWDAEAGRELWSCGLGDPVVSLDVDEAGERIAAATTDGSVYVRRLADGAPLFELAAHRKKVTAVHFAARDSRLLTAGADGLAIVWNTNDHSEVCRIDAGGPLVDAAIAPDGHTLATLRASTDHAVLWRTDDGVRLGTISAAGGVVRHVAFRPDGGAVGAAGDGGMLCIRSLPSGAEQTLPIGDPIVHFAWSRDGTRLLISSRGDGNLGLVRLWRLGDPGESLRFQGHSNTVQCNAFDASGEHAVTSSIDGRICIWPTDPVGAARRLPLRALTDADRRQYRIPSPSPTDRIR